ncbi:MAG: YggS family pyridoxal phosphate-dependent enzyme [Clostridia bacterium]|nr:YggS family pyridoxal phosphate-dependent enzyme [Clostridia bacterium]
MDERLLRERLARVRAELAEASEGRFPVPKLIAVTKTHAPEVFLPLAEMGQTDIGENRVQEIVEKLPVIQGKFRIHQIGRLQSNKVKYIIDNVCLIHSLDRLSLAEEIDRQAIKCGRSVPVLVQVSPAGEPQKGGMPPEAVLPFLREAARMPGLSVRGLMAVMPLTQDEAYLTELFTGMRTLFEHLREEAVNGVVMEELSMGMSGDYRLAAKCGATMVRVGSALFGPRG